MKEGFKLKRLANFSLLTNRLEFNKVVVELD